MVTRSVLSRTFTTGKIVAYRSRNQNVKKMSFSRSNCRSRFCIGTLNHSLVQVWGRRRCTRDWFFLSLNPGPLSETYFQVHNPFLETWTRHVSIATHFGICSLRTMHCATCYSEWTSNISHHKMINVSPSPTSPTKTKSLENDKKWSNNWTKASHLSPQTSRSPVLTPKASTTN